MKKSLYDSRQALIHIRYLKHNWNGYGAEAFKETLVNKCWLIAIRLRKQPECITPTGRSTIRFEWEMENKSYLEFEIYEDKITTLAIEKREYDKAITKTLYSRDLETIVKDMNLFIRLFFKEDFKEMKRIVEVGNDDKNQNQ